MRFSRTLLDLTSSMVTDKQVKMYRKLIGTGLKLETAAAMAAHAAANAAAAA